MISSFTSDNDVSISAEADGQAGAIVVGATAIDAGALQCLPGGIDRPLQGHRKTPFGICSREKARIERAPNIPAHLVDTTLKRLHGAFANFFRRAKDKACKKKGFPRFKTANRWHSLQFRADVSGCSIRDTYFSAPKKMGGKIRFNRHRDIKGTVKFCLILRKPSGWYLQVICEQQRKLLPKTGKSIGLDFGIISLVADSEGGKVENPRHFKWALRKLRMAQRRIARRKKGSNRRKKACRLAARIHEHIGNQRRDHLHKTACDYVNRFDMIAVEDLNVSGMAQNGHLARSIYDASWAMLRQLIEVKAEKAGRKVIAVPAHYTSQKCSKCKEIVQKALSVRTHCCPHCGHTECRDTNAARNILALAPLG